MNAFELLSFCVGKSLSDLFDAKTLQQKRQKKESYKKKASNIKENLQRDALINSQMHVHVFSYYHPQKTFSKVHFLKYSQ